MAENDNHQSKLSGLVGDKDRDGEIGGHKVSCHAHEPSMKVDKIFYLFAILIFVLLVLHGFNQWLPAWIVIMSDTAIELVGIMWWGVLLGAFFVGLLSKVPESMLVMVLGQGGTGSGIGRAIVAGMLLDLCSHGILLVAMKLYRKGVSIGQVVAFLVASPWNSLTLTFLLVGLVGLPLTLLFILASGLIAWMSGMVFDALVQRQILPKNVQTLSSVDSISVVSAFRNMQFKGHFGPRHLLNIIWAGLKESQMILRWVLFGIILVAVIRAWVPSEVFSSWFGPSFLGLLATLGMATIVEVCSEGSSPIAADLVNRTGAVGNGFTFLMAGAATDYTEIMALKETTTSWKIALFLPLVTVPQIVFIGWLMNVGL